MKKHYEDATTAYKQEILNLKTALQEVQNREQGEILGAVKNRCREGFASRY